MIELSERLQRALGPSYAVEEPLGAGGFATVFRVRDLSLKRALAVKVLAPEMIASSTALERFRREAETVAQLSHPNIVPLHFIGQSDDLVYLVMACVDGGSVADRLARAGPLPVADVVRLLTEVADALAYAHRRGVVHRDVKPQNVLLDAESGRALVTDFGIARTADSSTLTATGMSVGTPAYLAPEQVLGELSDHRADLYALGVMAHEVLAGRPPFDGPTPQAVAMKRLHGPPASVAGIRPDVPVWLAEVITRCLATEPAARFQRAEDVVEALSARTSNAAVSTAGAKRPRMLAAVVIGLAIAASIAVMVVRSTNDATTPTPVSSDTSLIAIPGGQYLIGTNSGAPSARPVHAVSLAPFAIQRQLVTVADFMRFARDVRIETPGMVAIPDSTLPVTHVTWAEAAGYCRWRFGDAARLPTEEEWEAAARTETKALRDLTGRVWQWTRSDMRAYPSGGALPDSLAQYKVIRGGAVNTPAALATIWYRGYNRASASRAQLANTGFRCVVAMADQR